LRVTCVGVVEITDVIAQTLALKMSLQMLGQCVKRNHICLVVCHSMKFIHFFHESTTGIINSCDETR
jgi:hypothetical protein